MAQTGTARGCISCEESQGPELLVAVSAVRNMARTGTARGCISCEEWHGPELLVAVSAVRNMAQTGTARGCISCEEWHGPELLVLCVVHGQQSIETGACVTQQCVPVLRGPSQSSCPI